MESIVPVGWPCCAKTLARTRGPRQRSARAPAKGYQRYPRGVRRRVELHIDLMLAEAKDCRPRCRAIHHGISLWHQSFRLFLSCGCRRRRRSTRTNHSRGTFQRPHQLATRTRHHRHFLLDTRQSSRATRFLRLPTLPKM
jgi:hypothetical protein